MLPRHLEWAFSHLSPPCINCVHSRWGYAFPVRMCIPGESQHYSWWGWVFLVRTNHKGINIENALSLQGEARGKQWCMGHSVKIQNHSFKHYDDNRSIRYPRSKLYPFLCHFVNYTKVTRCCTNLRLRNVVCKLFKTWADSAKRRNWSRK